MGCCRAALSGACSPATVSPRLPGAWGRTSPAAPAAATHPGARGPEWVTRVSVPRRMPGCRCLFRCVGRCFGLNCGVVIKGARFGGRTSSSAKHRSPAAGFGRCGLRGWGLGGLVQLHPGRGPGGRNVPKEPHPSGGGRASASAAEQIIADNSDNW